VLVLVIAAGIASSAAREPKKPADVEA